MCVTGAEHAEACELARIAVAVWRSKPSAFTQFHNWMFDGGRTRTATEARRYGEQLVGRERLAQELAKPYAAQYIAKHIELYNRMGAGAVPKLLFPRATMVGEVSSPQTLCGMIERELGQGQAQR